MEQTGDSRLFYSVLHNRAFIAQHEGDHADAIDLMRRSLMFWRDMNDNYMLATDLHVLAGSLGAAGEPEHATRLLGAAEHVLERLGAFQEPAEKMEFDRIIAAVRAQLDDMTFQTTWAEGRAMTLDQAVAEALKELT